MRATDEVLDISPYEPHDSVSDTHGAGSGYDVCGTREYSLSSVTLDSTNYPGEPSGALDLASDLTLAGKVLTLSPNTHSDVGQYTITIEVKLTSYPAITKLLQFSVTVNPCLITGFDYLISDGDYTLYDAAITWNFVAYT